MGSIYTLADSLLIGRRCPYCGKEWTIEAVFYAESYSHNSQAVRQSIQNRKAKILASDTTDYGGLCPSCERFNPVIEQKYFGKGYRAWLQEWINACRPGMFGWILGFYATILLAIFALWVFSAPGSGKFFMPRTIGCVALSAFFTTLFLITYIGNLFGLARWQRNRKRMVNLDETRSAKFIKIVYRNGPSLLPRTPNPGTLSPPLDNRVESMQNTKRIILEYLQGSQRGHRKKMRKFLDGMLSQI